MPAQKNYKRVVEPQLCRNVFSNVCFRRLFFSCKCQLLLFWTRLKSFHVHLW